MDHAELFRRIMFARDRVYRLYAPTPIEPVLLPSGRQAWLKREDLSPINSYKWRGAFNKMSIVLGESPGRAVVAASAGNHAQGVAAAAAKLGCRATIFMPRSTPEVKIRSVRRLGGDAIRIELVGDTFDDASAAAREFMEREGAAMIAPFDDPEVIAGQGTIGDEIVTSAIRPDIVFLEIGGGGMAAGVACVLRTYFGDAVRLVGVEGEGQASMTAAMDAGEPITLDRLDRFCDGTAVRRTGSVTFPLCRSMLDEIVLVSNAEVSTAIRMLWESARIIPEPSGALGMAAMLRFERDGHLAGAITPLTIVSGSNIDFAMLSLIARRAAIGATAHRYYEFTLAERAGELVTLLESLPPLQIVEFQYGKTNASEAHAVIGFEGSDDELTELARAVESLGQDARPVTGKDRVEYRVIPLEPQLFSIPVYLSIDFPERAGAMLEFMHRVRDIANICYFNYQYTGEAEGHSLLAFEFASEADRTEFLHRIEHMPMKCRELSASDLGMDRVEPVH
ncbi:MAG: pyridoxal-phosphate dependent enzyme [Planctomycetota bacterium]